MNETTARPGWFVGPAVLLFGEYDFNGSNDATFTDQAIDAEMSGRVDETERAETYDSCSEGGWK